MDYYGGGGYGGTSSMMGRMDPVKITLGVLVLLLAGAAGYLAYKYNSQCAGANGVTCSGTGVKIVDGVCTAEVTSCGDGTPDKDGVCRYSASSADGDGGFSLGTTGIIGIVVAGVLLLMGAGIFGLKKNYGYQQGIRGKDLKGDPSELSAFSRRFDGPSLALARASQAASQFPGSVYAAAKSRFSKTK